jgi:hypothetical protein
MRKQGVISVIPARAWTPYSQQIQQFTGFPPARSGSIGMARPAVTSFTFAGVISARRAGAQAEPGEQLGKHGRLTLGVGVRQGGARQRSAAEMVVMMGVGVQSAARARRLAAPDNCAKIIATR